MLWNILLQIINLIKLAGGILFTIVFIGFFNFIISNLLITRNTILWFLGESHMIGFLTIQAIWFTVYLLMFTVIYRVMKHP